MLGLLMLSSIAIAGVAAATGLFDSGDPTPEQEIDDADLTRDPALLDGTQISEMEAALGQAPLLAQSEVETDFNPAEEALLLGVYATGVDLPEGSNSLELGYTLREIQTDLGAATRVMPASSDAITVETLGEGASLGYSVLLGVSPADQASVEIRVVLQNDQTDWASGDLIDQIAREMGATRL